MLEPRTPVMILVEASWEDHEGARQAVAARMEDRSDGGACIRLKTKIEVGCKLGIQWRWEKFSGIAKYCRREGPEYVVGLQRDTPRNPSENGPICRDLPQWERLRGSDVLVSAARVKSPPQPPGSRLEGNLLPRRRVGELPVARLATYVPASPSSKPVPEPQIVGHAKLPGSSLGEILVPRHSVEEVPVASHVLSPPLRPPVSESGIALPARPLGGSLGEIPVPRHSVEGVPVAPIASHPPSPAPRAPVPEPGIDRRALLRTPQPHDFHAPQKTELGPQQAPKGEAAGKERERMPRKWLEMTPWNNKQDAPNASGGAHSNGQGAKENRMPPLTPSTERAAEHSALPAAADEASFQVELVSMEDIYRTAGIMIPRKGYSIKKVIEMLNSEHIRGLSKDMKRVAVLMALDAAGVAIDEILQDAKTRQQALDTHEAEQKKRAEAEWARKLEENTQIEAELERLKTHHLGRIARNLDAVAREKATFNNWLTMKQQESQNMAEATELCLKPASPAPLVASPPEPSAPKALAKTV